MAQRQGKTSIRSLQQDIRKLAGQRRKAKLEHCKLLRQLEKDCPHSNVLIHVRTGSLMHGAGPRHTTEFCLCCGTEASDKVLNPKARVAGRYTNWQNFWKKVDMHKRKFGLSLNN